MPDRIGIVALVAAFLAVAPAIRRVQQPAESAPATRTAAQQNIIVLSIDDFSRPYVQLLFEAFSKELLGAAGAPAVYFESLDASRFERPQYLEDLRAWLRRKYEDTRIDMVVPLGEDALGFLADAQGEPWPTAQVLYLEAGSVRVDTRPTLPRAGGLLLTDHFADAVGTIKTILPDTRNIALVYGASTIEIARWRGFAEKVRKAHLEPIDLVGLSVDETVAAVERLPAGTAVMLLSPSVDARGNVLPPSQTCNLISTAGASPVFTLAAHDLGCGVVGGLMRDWRVVGRSLALEVQSRLERASTEVRLLPLEKFTALAFDDRQLQRWRIPEGRLPAGAAVLFREPNLWRDHRGLLLSGLGVTILQSLLIAGLVFERRRRRRAELDSRRHLAAMAHLDRRAAMGELATSLAHELNQPLNAILQNAGVAQMLLAANTVPPALGEMQDIISDIRKDDIRASEVIRRMRALLQKHELESQPVNMNDVAQETVAIVRPDANARDIRLEVDLEDQLQPILGDRVHIQQVLLNILMNAVDAVASSPADRRRVRVRTRQGKGDVRVAVTDTGAGIAAEETAEIFEPFYTTKNGGAGMGMGLAIARSIVEAHGGSMAADNNPGGGATVSFSVPAAPG